MSLLKKIKSIIPGRVYAVLVDMIVYVANHVVCHVPSHIIRLWFYRKFMRWEIGSNTSIHEGLRLLGVLSGVRIGSNTCIGQDAYIAGSGFTGGEIEIGNNVNIAMQVFIASGGHMLGPEDSFSMINKPVVIEDHAVVFARATLVMCRIGRGAVVLPGAVVTSDVEPFTVVGGVPARKVKDREPKIDPTYRLDWRWRFH